MFSARINIDTSSLNLGLRMMSIIRTLHIECNGYIEYTIERRKKRLKEAHSQPYLVYQVIYKDIVCGSIKGQSTSKNLQSPHHYYLIRNHHFKNR